LIKKDIKGILRDIYGCQYGTIREYGLADAVDAEDFNQRLSSLEDQWSKISPGFYNWFCRKRSQLFIDSVIESARKNTNINGLFYNNSIESMHFREKKEQCFKEGTIEDVVSTLKKLVQRQQDDEVRALYGSGPYKLSNAYQRFSIDSTRWHSMAPENRKKCVESFRKYNPTLEESFKKPSQSGKKPCQRVRKKRKTSSETIIDRLSKDFFRVNNPHGERKVAYTIYLRSLVPRLVERCQGNCGERLRPADTDDYLLVRSHGPSTYMVNGEMKTKYGPQYIHFHSNCLKEYSMRKHEKEYETFPFEIIRVDEKTLRSLSDAEVKYIKNLGIDC
jgi:hypothetical protein